jgi:hypothetical protein
MRLYVPDPTTKARFDAMRDERAARAEACVSVRLATGEALRARDLIKAVGYNTATLTYLDRLVKDGTVVVTTVVVAPPDDGVVRELLSTVTFGRWILPCFQLARALLEAPCSYSAEKQRFYREHPRKGKDGAFDATLQALRSSGWLLQRGQRLEPEVLDGRAKLYTIKGNEL